MWPIEWNSYGYGLCPWCIPDIRNSQELSVSQILYAISITNLWWSHRNMTQDICWDFQQIARAVSDGPHSKCDIWIRLHHGIVSHTFDSKTWAFVIPSIWFSCQLLWQSLVRVYPWLNVRITHEARFWGWNWLNCPKRQQQQPTKLFSLTRDGCFINTQKESAKEGFLFLFIWIDITISISVLRQCPRESANRCWCSLD